MKIHSNNIRFELDKEETIITGKHPKADDYSVLHNGKVIDEKVVAIVLTKKIQDVD